MGILESINSPIDLKELQIEELNELCAELRDFIIHSVSRTGGHLASNLGVIELTVAIHKVFDTSTDRLVFDVGHQCYAHKILTGRKNSFSTLRQFGGISGFPKPSESVHDAFIAGHASASISNALGLARARTLSEESYDVLAVIGDGALTGGLSYEALSDVGETGEPLIIILNDNGMSINGNVGGIAKYLSRRRMGRTYVEFKQKFKRLTDKLPCGSSIYKITSKLKNSLKGAIFHYSMFEELGLQYSGPIDGHDVNRIIEALHWAKKLGKPVVIHVVTQKGKGYVYSEASPETYHGIHSFEPGFELAGKEENTFSTVFGEELVKIAAENRNVCAVTASMTMGTGLSGFAERFPDRFFDVGIAEGHALSMAAGMAARGALPVFAVYSSFLQRSYDMLLHDVAIDRQRLILAVDRAGLVPGDGETHQGVFDVSFLSTVPGLTIFSPSNYAELRDLLNRAAETETGPVAIRYPRGSEGMYKTGGCENVKMLTDGSDFTLVTYGTTVNTALEAVEKLQRENIAVELIKLSQLQPLEISSVIESVLKTTRLMVLEDSVASGSVGEKIAAELMVSNVALRCVILKNIGARFVPCGDIERLLEHCELDVNSVCSAIKKSLTKENVTGANSLQGNCSPLVKSELHSKCGNMFKRVI